jgi:hypothetical protein
MAQSVTRWDLSAQEPLYAPTLEALQPYIAAEQVNLAAGRLVFGPDEGIPEGQYESHRLWQTVELAQNWIDNIDSISIPLGFTAISKRIIE